MRIHGTTTSADNSTTILASGVVQSGVYGDAAGSCHCFITDIICPALSIISTDAGAGSTQLMKVAAGSHRFDPPLVCPSGAGVYSNTYDVTMTYYLKDTKARSGSYA
jgi:hypothetical protein